MSRFRKQLEQWAASPDTDPALVARRLAEIESAERKFAVDPPSEVVERIRSPWPSRRYVELLYAMTWRVICSNSEKFITSDNPAYFFEAYGIGSPESEVCCPLAPDVGLHMSRQGEPGGLLFVAGRRAWSKRSTVESRLARCGSCLAPTEPRGSSVCATNRTRT